MSSSIINTNFLWPQIRVLGGAYGAGISVNDSNLITMYSYRDPNVAKTYETFDKIIDYINNLSLTDEQLNNYKIGAIGSLQMVLHPKKLASYGRIEYLSGRSKDEAKKILYEIKDAKLSDIKDIANLFIQAKNKFVRCAIGSVDKLKENETLFDEIRKVF